MGDSNFRSGRNFGFQSDGRYDSTERKTDEKENNRREKDEDLVIEENTIYEIDRECYERMKRQKRR